MSKKLTPEEVLPGIINGYRAVKKSYYQYSNLSERYELPPSFDEARIALFRDYFLEYIYPPPAKRAELDAAFQHLDTFITRPEKLFRILIDSTAVLFKYGRHLPKIFKAGIASLQSFRTATAFEKHLVQQAIDDQMAPPYSEKDIVTLLKALPNDQLEIFIKNSQTLFEIFHDRKLINNIISIMKTLIEKMQKRPKLFNPQEINGLQLGLNIVEKGNEHFEQLPKDEQKQLIDFVVMIERDFLEAMF